MTVPAGNPIARLSAAHILSRHKAAELARAIIFVPNRRAAVVMRAALQQTLNGKASLLPRILPLAEIDHELLTLLGKDAFAILESIPPAMSPAQQRYLLTEQVAAFERRRMGAVSYSYALKLAEALMQLQENCARNGVTITQEKLRPLVHADFATHWNQALLFLGILTDSWPQIERDEGRTIAACREVALMHALGNYWSETPADYPVYAVGSTASQPATAALLKTIADISTGQVILPGLDPTIDAAIWQRVVPGHPLYHVKSFLDLWPVAPDEVTPLAPPSPNIWLEALAPAVVIPQWKTRPFPEYKNIHLIPCAHGEEEVRVITLLLREALEDPAHHVALVTPDEALMARVAAHMKRYDLAVDRLNAGTLANTATGSLWVALIAAIAEPERQLNLRALLHHPLLGIDAALLNGLEKGWHGINRSRAGQLPRHDAALKEHPHYLALASFVQQLAQKRRPLLASAWLEVCRTLLAPWVAQGGQAQDAVMEALGELTYADSFGTIDIEDFSALLNERLKASWRDAGLNTHPRLHLLTPVEARLQQFDRVILANMQEQLWPGSRPSNPWLNLAAEQALELPAEAEHISLMAHDVLMLASHGDVFLTYPQRDGGSPAPRSRFIERLVTLLASHGIAEQNITAAHYAKWASAQYKSANFAPENPIFACPAAAQRPVRLPVTAIDALFTDPFSIYARHVLKLQALDAVDASPEASDFGSLTHKAIEQLTTHWNVNGVAATQEELDAIAEHALRSISDRPNIDIFWRTRLLGGLHWINRLEAVRRAEPVRVEAERPVEALIALPHQQSITLHGRIDRIEMGEGGARIIDHKTGEIPKLKHILEGRALQLLAYAMVLAANGTPVQAVEYWQLPRLGDEGKRLSVDVATDVAELEGKLREALAQMQVETTPFLARPVSTSADERFGNPYDGISRYDEWAG